MPEYVVNQDPDQVSYHVIHTPTDHVVSTIHMLKRVKRFGGDDGLVYRVTNQPGVNDKWWTDLHQAIKHSISQHKKAIAGKLPHPMQAVGDMLNKLGQHIWSSTKDPRMNPEELKKIQAVAAAHAKMIKVYNDQYNK